jgi:hypothetical protein
VSTILSMPLAVRSQAQVCGRTFTGIAGSNPAHGLNVVPRMCCVLCRKRSLRRADHSFRGVLLNVCLSVCVCVYLIVCHLETSTVRRSRFELGRSGPGKKELYIV